MPVTPYQRWAPTRCAMCGDAIGPSAVTYVAIELMGWPVIVLDRDCYSALVSALTSLSSVIAAPPLATATK